MTSRRFRLIRHHDVSGVSGTGPVAEGVQFTDGAVALRWYGDYPTTTVWDAIESVIAIHGHQGATEVEWIDPDPGPDPGFKLKPRSDLPPRPWPDLHPAPEPAPEPEFKPEPEFRHEPTFKDESEFSREPSFKPESAFKSAFELESAFEPDSEFSRGFESHPESVRRRNTGSPDLRTT